MLRELALAGRRLRVGAGRRHGRRRGADVHVDARTRACPDELLEPFEHGRFIIRGELDAGAEGASCSSGASSGRSRCATTRRSRRGTASRSPRSPRRARGSNATTGSTRRGALGEFLLGPLSTPEGRLYRTYRNGVAKNTGFLEDYADVAHGLYELHVATGEPRWLEESRRLALLAVELFGDEERGGFFLTPADGEALVARKKDFDDHPTPSGNSMLAYVLLRLARIYGDAELERHAVGVFRLIVNGLRRAPSAFGWALCALELHFSPPRELAIFAEPDDEIARAALAPWQPNAVVAFGPADGVPLLEGKAARRRQADRLRLRELRLPRAGDRRRGARYADAVACRRRCEARVGPEP